MLFYPEEKTIILIDGMSLYSSAKAAGQTVDYRSILEYFKETVTLIRGIFYTPTDEGVDHNPIKPLIDFLSYNGYQVKTRTYKDTVNGPRMNRPRMDVDLAVDAMEMAAHVDHIVIASGKGDFVSLVHALQRQGVKVTIMTVLDPADGSQTPTSAGISDELRRVADQVIPLTMIKNALKAFDSEPRA